MSILVFGGDGFLGWPLTMKLARRFPDEQIVIVDNLTRRNLVDKVGGHSVTPILKLEDRIHAFKKAFGHTADITWINLDVTSPEVDYVVKTYKPRIAFNLAQVGSAPFSMQGPDESIFTVTNNETGNLRILWAIRQHAPECHIVKSGSFGTYAKCGVDIPEGYYFPEFNGKKATIPAPFPKQSDDIYHITKINDTNFVSMACRKWGLRVTDVMQSTVFGVQTDETKVSPDLLTRFDHDEFFGTVVNRFIAQTVIRQPMTIYGTGWQRTGLMALNDALNSLVHVASEQIPLGRHRVINNVTEKSYCIREVAAKIQDYASKLGYAGEISLGTFDPRTEDDQEKMIYNIITDYVSSRISPTDIDQVIQETIDTVVKYENRVIPALLTPKFDWQCKHA